MALTKVTRNLLSTGIDDQSTSTAITIDSSGNLLVGTTDTNPSNNGASGDAGIALSGSGYISAARSSESVGLFNRMDSDGSILLLRKDGTDVGSISTFDGEVSFGRSGVGIMPVGSGSFPRVIPTNHDSNVIRDAAIDLGYSNARFKDLYLSGGVVFDAVTGNATSNTLNDYEEGTWTPVLRGASVAGTYEFATSGAYYTKVGRMVTVTANLVLSASITGGGSAYAKITGLPYAKGANMAPQGTVLFRDVDFADDADYVTVEFVTSSASSELYFPAVRDNAGKVDTDISGFGNSSTINLSITYFT